MDAPRTITVAAAQMAGNQLTDSRTQILDRMLNLMDQAAEAGVRLLAFPELALTTFFPTQYMTDPEQIAQYFEPASPSDPYAVLSTPHAKPLVEKANQLGMDFYLGFAERWTTGEDGEIRTTDYNTTIYYSVAAGEAIAKYRKVHLPGTKEPLEDPKAFQQLEKRYFTPGDLGFQAFRAPGLVEGALKAEDVQPDPDPKDTVGKGDPILGMLICNDRRWPEAWRPYGLQGAELVIEGYNTTAWAPQYPGTPEEQQSLAEFHHRLSCQAGSYQNGLWGLHVAKCGDENGQGLIGGSMIVDPLGRVVAEAQTADRDELVVATIDLALCRRPRDRVFNFEKHRRLEHYGLAGRQVGLEEIPLLGRAV
ncbi:carbon-nitrogen hydrolase [Apiospora rasikravindrae]|uniref:Carbon-nitrogen hydrolase n=1 Tax=Apiospora rasikravindrae TaxID=990691 RepID=A0ABR1RY65_9PEZI